MSDKINLEMSIFLLYYAISDRYVRADPLSEACVVPGESDRENKFAKFDFFSYLCIKKKEKK